MAEDKLAFELVAPERLLASMACDMVVVPGEEGDFGVLPQHAPVLALLRPGVITVYENDRVEQRVFVAGGFAEVNERGCTVLAEAAERVGEIDKAAAQERLRVAEEELAESREPSEAERERLERAIEVARVRLESLEAA